MRQWYDLSASLSGDIAAPALAWTSSTGHVVNHEERLRVSIARGEAVLADPEYHALVAALKSVNTPATMDDIADELTVLMHAFPTREDLSGFIPVAAFDLASEQPNRLRLAIAFRELRRTHEFRPSISEMLDAMHEVDLSNVNALMKIPDRVELVRERLAREIERSTVRKLERRSGWKPPETDGFPDGLAWFTDGDNEQPT